MSRLHALVLTALCVPSALPAQALPSRAAAASPDRAALAQRLQKQVDLLLAGGTFPGINVGVTLADGKTLAVSAGVADRDSRQPLTPSGRMPAGSVGKTYVAAVAMQLVKEGRLDLDARIERYLGQEPWFLKLPNAQTITVRMLMNHTSGLERHEFKPAFLKALTEAPDRNWKPEELLAYLFGDKPLFAAGKGWGYSDSDYIALGMIMERVTGRPYYELLRERILKPLGLKDSTAPETRTVPGLVQGYAGADNPFGGTDAMVQDGRIAFNPKSEWTGGGVVSTAADLSRWAKLLYEGRAFAPSLLPVMLQGVPARDLGPGIDYGLGVMLRSTELGPSYGHSGFFPGYRTQMLYFPEHRMAVAVQVNTSVAEALGRPLFELAMAAAKSVLPTTTPKAPPFLDWKGLKAGPYEVGFRAIATTDATRSFQTPTDYRGRPRPDFGNRPVQVSVWYPAEYSPYADRMTYGDYVALLAWELGAPKAGAEARQAAESQFLQMSGLPVTPEGRAAFETLYREKVGATKDAKPAAGPYPVLVCAPGQGYPAFDNSVLAEYLASHGYIVVASPSMGPDGREMPDSPAAMDAGARDLEYLVGYAQSLPQADPERIAAMGFSLGGSSAALCALRNARIKALVSLDGVLRDDRYLTQLKAFPQFQPEGLRGALLWIACGPANSLPGFGEGSFPEQAKYAELVKAVFPGLHHHDFSSMSSLQRRRAQGSSQDWSSATASYEAACRLILGFLDDRLKGIAQKLDQAPETLCKVTLRPALKAPPTATDFRETALREGLPKAAELIQIIQREHAGLLPSFEEPLVLMGYEALGRGNTTFAIQLFSLTVATFPHSIDGAYGLGKAYLTAGSFEQAAPHYRSARAKVEQDPGIPAAQKAGILARIDKILDDLQVKKTGKP